MKKGLLFILTVVLAFSLAGCLPSYGAEAEEHFWRGIEYTQQEMDLSLIHI